MLVRAGVHVDVCYVCKKTEDKKPKSKGKAKQVATPKTKRKRKRASPPPDVTSEEEIVPINPEVESEDEEAEECAALSSPPKNGTRLTSNVSANIA